MQNNQQEKFLLVERQDGKLSIGIQPYSVQLIIVQCFQCKKKNQCPEKTQFMRCGQCKSINKIFDPDPSFLKQVNCSVCDRRIDVPRNATLIKCPYCESICHL